MTTRGEMNTQWAIQLIPAALERIAVALEKIASGDQGAGNG